MTAISQNAFTLCEGLLSVVIPNSVKTIDVTGFFGCSSLTSITIPNSVTSIGRQAFASCSSLMSINIPNSVKSIGNQAFSDCVKLKTVNVFSTSLDSYGLYVFRNNAEGRKIYVMAGCEETYKTMWKSYADDILPFTMDFALSNSGENTDVIDNNDGKVVDVMLYDRTLYKDGDWNTICLPFDVDIENSSLVGATARTLSSASITDDMTLSLSFGSPVSTLKAGVPYLIKWDSGDDIVDPMFLGVTVNKELYVYDNNASGDARVRFMGTNRSIAFSDDDNVLLLGSKNTLYYAGSGMAIGAQRAYFRIGDDNVSNARRITSFNLDFEDEATAIDDCEVQSEESSWYTLQGVKLGGKPAQNGVYIHNGKKIIIK